MVQEILGKLRKKTLIKSFFRKDDYLSEVLNKNVYILFNFLNKSEEILLESLNELCNQYLQEDLFIFVKVKTNLIRQINKIESLGFRLIDTNITFSKSSNLRYESVLDDDIIIKFSESSHKNFIGEIAYNNFKFSRFHLDPNIKKSQADNLKKCWVENFFSGQRGDYMIIALRKNKPIGFLQLIKEKKKIIIDLIAVSSGYRGKRIGSSMIEFACNKIQFDIITAGTQISNLPSINLYSKLGFKPITSDYVFHFHNI